MKEHVWINSRNKRLSAMLHQQEGSHDPAIVIFCHGFTGEKVGGSQFYLHLANAIEAAGYAALRFDYAGSGESEGEFAIDTTVTGWTTDLQHVIAWVTSQKSYENSPIYILGHSLGGCIALLCDDPKHRIAGRIAIAPEVFPEENYRNSILGPVLWRESENGKIISHFFGKSYSLEPGFVRDMLDKKHDPIEASKSYDCPVLLIHGTEDDAVPFSGSKSYYNQYSGPKELHLIEGADHGFSRHLTELKACIIKFLNVNA
ncbi:alpha-beta hydrolase superfamily lysophospholipase [Paenibacillus rhizosphaerae]|uniref:Alpha-beta hydrolase superfamily lysophospholipase n=1 Tax=Paenibacillus rhizosphaerae TaxID=297318 RepID=A0A839TTQ7_9BACL|nr:alpha/beta fold hydrolase [Paenibacillus rhizosphaerae]MBB3128669.1 alpha-beta hydrolase superfamily lysophospholipase [Paenibacillus rhizosphaerae]